MTVATLQLREPGPAQSNLIYHFCGRPPGTGVSPRLDVNIAAMPPQDRLTSILWDGMLRGSPPFGAANPMVCFSESPVRHLHWLLGERSFPPWALLFSRQWVYNFGGGPVWYARDAQYRTLSAPELDWAVRFEAYSSDWLHEREWRIPVQPGYGGLRVTSADVQVVIVGEPDWQPWRQVREWTGSMLDEYGQPSPYGQEPEMYPQWRLSPLWNQIHAFWWDRVNRRFVHVHAPAQR
ncbi:hypothetical protein ACIA5G_41990 [Amycolatopsis sp. NPDC051758]|uniref:hypothetical protein n=1 Tax=Amycolatopsis sp. NPDC051758 TaxID=3363935 RepID=UPI003799539B